MKQVGHARLQLLELYPPYECTCGILWFSYREAASGDI